MILMLVTAIGRSPPPSASDAEGSGSSPGSAVTSVSIVATRRRAGWRNGSASVFDADLFRFES